MNLSHFLTDFHTGVRLFQANFTDSFGGMGKLTATGESFPASNIYLQNSFMVSNVPVGSCETLLVSLGLNDANLR